MAFDAARSRRSLPRRFRGLSWTVVAGHRVPLAETALARVLGLALLDRDRAGPGLLIPRCRSVHTLGMRFALDVVFLDRDGGVISRRLAVPPGRLLLEPRAASVLERPGQPSRAPKRRARTVWGVIWLLRHGDAEEGPGDDDSRRLTPKGEQQGRKAGRALAALGAELDACLSSPKLRAVEMARLACESLGLTVETADELAGGGFDPLELAAGRGNVVLIGHDPDLSSAIALLTGASVAMKKGGLASIDNGQLVALLRPEHLERIAG